jgi:hypothetical protein
MKKTTKSRWIIAEEIGQDSYSVEGKILSKSEVELLYSLMPGSSLVWLKYFTKKKPWE